MFKRFFKWLEQLGQKPIEEESKFHHFLAGGEAAKALKVAQTVVGVVIAGKTIESLIHERPDSLDTVASTYQDYAKNPETSPVVYVSPAPMADTPGIVLVAGGAFIVLFLLFLIRKK